MLDAERYKTLCGGDDYDAMEVELKKIIGGVYILRVFGGADV